MTEKMNVAKIFGENVFNDKVMHNGGMILRSLLKFVARISFLKPAREKLLESLQ